MRAHGMKVWGAGVGAVAGVLLLGSSTRCTSSASPSELVEVCAGPGMPVTMRAATESGVCARSGDDAVPLSIRLTAVEGGQTFDLPVTSNVGDTASAVLSDAVPKGNYTVSVICKGSESQVPEDLGGIGTLTVPCPSVPDSGIDARPDGQTDPDGGTDGSTALAVTGTAYCVMPSNTMAPSTCGAEVLKPSTPQEQAVLAATVAFEKGRALIGGPAVGTCGAVPFTPPPMGTSPNADLGMKIVMNGNGALVVDLLRQGNGSYNGSPPAPAPHGKAITFDFVGGPDLPAKAGVAVGTAPPLFTVDGSGTLVLSTTAPTTITWPAFSAPVFYMQIAGFACRFDPMAGTGTVPASFAMMLPPSGLTTFRAVSWTEAPLGNGQALGVNLIEEQFRSYQKQ